MQLDQCIGYPAERRDVERAMDLSSRWAERCYAAHTRPDQALFGIVQGGMHLDLRIKSLERLENMGNFPGYGIGGYSVGEDHETMFESLAPLASEYMPRSKPRYLMGVGNPTTLVRGVACGIDMFDCVLPTRTGRMGTAFSQRGALELPQRPVRPRHAAYRPRLHLPGVHGRVHACSHSSYGDAEGDAWRHLAFDAQHLFLAGPYASRAHGHYRGHLWSVRAGMDGFACGCGLLTDAEAAGTRPAPPFWFMQRRLPGPPQPSRACKTVRINLL